MRPECPSCPLPCNVAERYWIAHRYPIRSIWLPTALARGSYGCAKREFGALSDPSCTISPVSSGPLQIGRSAVHPPSFGRHASSIGTQRSVNHDVQKVPLVPDGKGKTAREFFQTCPSSVLPPIRLHPGHATCSTGRYADLAEDRHRWCRPCAGRARRPGHQRDATIRQNGIRHRRRLVNEDGNVAGNGLEQVKDRVTAAATDLAKQGGGRLVIAKAGGGPAQQVAARDLSVIGPDGQMEHDPETRERITGDRIAAAFAEADTKRVAEPGRNILSLLTMAEELAPDAGQAYQVFLVGFGLGTEDPADARIQTVGDPSQAVDALAGRLPDLSGAEIDLFFPAAAGIQQPLNVVTSNWRESYWKDLANATNARLGDVTDLNVPADPVKGAPNAPEILNIPDPTYEPPVPIPAPLPPDQPQAPPAPTVLAGSSFQPNSAEFVDEAAATAQLQPLADAWLTYPGSYSTVDCIGRTAKSGFAEGAIKLSQERAETAKTVLLRLGAGTVTAQGRGFDDPLPGIDPTDPQQRSVSCQLIPQTPETDNPT